MSRHTPRIQAPQRVDADKAGPEIEAQKTSSDFDSYLAELIIIRAEFEGFYTPSERNIRVAELIPEIRQHVDERLIECICSNDPLANHNVRLPKYPRYKREDTVQQRVRSLVEATYPKAHKEFIRKKTHGCMMTIQNAVAFLNV